MGGAVTDRGALANAVRAAAQRLLAVMRPRVGHPMRLADLDAETRAAEALATARAALAAYDTAHAKTWSEQ